MTVCFWNTNYGLGIDALVIACSWNTNGIMVWAWMLLEHERNYGLGMDAAGPRMLLEHERNYGLGMDALVIACSWNTNGIMVWAWMLLEHERNYGLGMDAAGPRMLLEHERNYGLGMDALVIACSWNTNGIMVWAWILW